METQTNGFLWTLLTRKKTKKHKNNFIKNKIERANTELNRESDSTKPQSQTRMFSRRKKTFLSFILSLFYLFVAPVMQVLPVYAAEPAEIISVWEVMETQLVGANSIITDQAVVNAYSSTLGNIAAEGATAEVINIGIQNAASQCGVDLGQVFANTAESAAAVGVEAAAASAGENLAASCAALTAGGVASAVLPALGGVAASAGIHYIVNNLKHICYMVNDIWRNNIETGRALITNTMYENFNPPNLVSGGCISSVTTNRAATSYLAYPSACYSSEGSTTIQVVFINPSNTGIRCYKKYGDGSTSSPSLDAYSYRSVGGTQEQYLKTSLMFGSLSQLQTYLNNIRDGVIQVPLTQADGISSVQGPLTYDPNNPDVFIPNIPELYPLPDYANGYGLQPIPEADYQNIVTYINGQEPPYTKDDQEEQKRIYPVRIRPFIDPHLTPIGDPTPDPDPDPDPDPQPTGTPDPNPTGTPDPNPTGTPDPNPNPNPKPNTQPFPDPETVPQPTPVVNPTPDSDIVPAPVPYPDPETPTEQDKTDTDTRITPIDLRDKFPFCIPFDMLKIMKLFQGGREAPCFTWEIPFGIAGSGSVTVDLTPWDDVATLMRTLELILFIMLLAVGTRNLLGGSS